MLDCGRGLNRSSTEEGSGSFLVVPWSFVGVRGSSWRNGLSLSQDSGINTEVSLLKIIFKSEF